MPNPRASVLILGCALLAGCGDVTPGGRSSADGWPVALEETEGTPWAFERVVLVTLDTLRADHVSCYGYRRPTTPFLDSLAARGALFENALASVSHTAPSHATMLTGLVPAAHGVLNNGDELAPQALDLARLFRGKAYETAASLNVQFLSGITGGFDAVRVSAIGEQEGRRVVLNGKHVVDAALDWAKHERKSERFFLWVHLYDPHRWKDLVLGTPPDVPLWKGETPDDFLPYVARMHGVPEPEPGKFAFLWNAETKAGETIDTSSPEAFLRCIDAYDAKIAFADLQVERLHRELEALGLPGRTLWIVTSDHGEGLASHGVAGHGSRIYQEQLRVPLVIHASDGSIAPRRFEKLVGHVDLFATLADGLAEDATGTAGVYDGRSLWPLMSKPQSPWPERALFAQRRPPEGPDDPEQAHVFALQDRAHKYILHEPGDDEFFDLGRDPRELESLAGRGGAPEAELRRALEDRLGALRAFAESRASAGASDVPEEWVEELKELGY
jgi:arylsulfatase A-like enzyme